MKRSVLLLVFSFFLFLSGISQTRIYINYVSHNEDAYQYLNNQSIYMNTRDGIRNFANDCKTRGAKWSIGSDFVFLQAVAIYDTGSVIQNTDNKNVLLWLHDNMDVECDPHSHESAYNYADVAYLHTLLGVTPSSVRSGFIYNGGTWMNYQNPVQGDSFPSYSWQAEIIWGAATPGHVNDPLYYGMWKPKDTSNFFVHEASNHLINYGSGCKIVASDLTNNEILQIIDNLINEIDSNIAPQTGFYCTSIFFEESNLKNPPFLLRMRDLTDSINLRVASGNVEWKHIEDVAQIWKTNYSSQAFFASCDMQDIYSNIDKNEVINNINIYPNPAQNYLVVKSGNIEVENIEIIDVLGKRIKQFGIQDSVFEIQIGDLPKGIYFLKLQMKQGVTLHKFIKE